MTVIFLMKENIKPLTRKKHTKITGCKTGELLNRLYNYPTSRQNDVQVNLHCRPCGVEQDYSRNTTSFSSRLNSIPVRGHSHLKRKSNLL